MLTLATILDNPGEPEAATRYRDPAELVNLGYTGTVIYSTTGLSGLQGADTLDAPDMRKWVGEQLETVHHTAEAARAAGLSVYLTFDATSLAHELVTPAMRCVGSEHMLCPASDELLRTSVDCLNALVESVDAVDGVVLRLGDSDAHRMPYLTGNDIYASHCARCAAMNHADRLTRWITTFYQRVVAEMGKTLIVRGWNVRPGGLHDTPGLCEQVVGALPEDDRLILSFKFTHADFWRYQRWNPASLRCGDRPVIYELQCQREFEGKGALPNYQPPLWRDGMGEVGGAMGLAEAAKHVNLAGLWAWVRGGGWGGPFIAEETWIDANAWAVPQLAADPAADAMQLAGQWADQRLSIETAPARSVLMDVLDHSPEVVRKLFYIGEYARRRDDPWYPSGHFIQDDLIDAEAGWQMIRRLPEDALEPIVEEKRQVVEQLAADRRAIQQHAEAFTQPHGQALVHELEYAEALAESMYHLLSGMVALRRLKRRDDARLRRSVLDAMHRCQSHWTHHQRYANYRGTATAFRSDNLWDFTQETLERYMA